MVLTEGKVLLVPNAVDLENSFTLIHHRFHFDRRWISSGRHQPQQVSFTSDFRISPWKCCSFEILSISVAYIQVGTSPFGDIVRLFPRYRTACQISSSCLSLARLYGLVSMVSSVATCRGSLPFSETLMYSLRARSQSLLYRTYRLFSSVESGPFPSACMD